MGKLKELLAPGLILLALLWFFLALLDPFAGVDGHGPYTEMLRIMEQERINSVEILNGRQEFYRVDIRSQYEIGTGRSRETIQKHRIYLIPQALLGEVIDKAKARHADVRVKVSYWQDIRTGTLQVVPLLIAAILLFGMLGNMRLAGGRGGDEARWGIWSSDKPSPQKSKVRFADIAGIGDAKDFLQDLVRYLKNPKAGSAGARIPRGVLLIGPPGGG